MPDTTVLLLRHGEVASHRGDVPVTRDGLLHAERVGSALADRFEQPITLLYGGTRRTRETAEAIGRGIGDRSRVQGPVDNFALRNPDMYAAGSRVNMVSSAETLAEQVPDMTAEQADANPWWAHFFSAGDRIGWWLAQTDPPGETSSDLAIRLSRFVLSIADPGPLAGRLIVGVTHSPLLRSLLLAHTGRDPGEPGYVTGAHVTVGGDRTLHVNAIDLLAATR